MEKKTSKEFALYRLERAKEEYETAEFYIIETAKELIELVEKYINRI